LDFVTRVDRLASDPAVVDALATRGVRPDDVTASARRDALRLAHAASLLLDHEPAAVLGSLAPTHLQDRLSRMDLRLDHVGREVACLLDSLLALWRDACEADGYASLPRGGPFATADGDLVFPSVQVLSALQATDPTLDEVTIARSFVLPPDGGPEVSVELFYAGSRDGRSGQNLQHMTDRLTALLPDPFRLSPAAPPVCHVSLEVAHEKDLEVVHEFARRDRSGLIAPYAADISANPGDGSLNTKMAVRRFRSPSAPTNVLEFVSFG